MSRRYTQAELSTEMIQLRLTPTVYDRIRGLAWYLREGHSEMLRRLAEEHRNVLVAQGKYPRLRAPDGADWQSLARKARDYDEPATKRIIVRMTMTERERLEGLAWYCKMTISELLRWLAEDHRKTLRSKGMNPPVKPPADGDGPITPRKR